MEPTQASNFFKYRKIIQYGLIISIIALLLLLLALLYNKLISEPKLEQLQKEIHISEQVNHFNEQTKNSYLSSQLNLQNYILTKDEQYLIKYNESLNELNNNLKKLANFASESELFALHLEKNSNKNTISVKDISSKIDSISKIKTPEASVMKSYFLKNKKFDYKNILDSISVKRNTSVDSVKRKGLFARVGDAISGKVDVQKEKENVVLTLGKGNSNGNEMIEKQFDQLFESINKYYQNEFEKYKKQYEQQFNVAKKEDNDFLEANKELLTYSSALLEKYNEALLSFTNEARRNFENSFQEDQKIKNLVVIGLLIFIVIIAILLIFLTRISFAYEKQLEEAKEKISDNLNFKKRIVAMISHEIRAPLNIISIYSKGIRRQVEDEDIKDSLKSIEFTTNSLSLLANQILEFSKKEDKSLQLNNKYFSLKEELAGTLSSLKIMVNENGNEFSIDDALDPSFDNVFSDSTKIHQLLYNLVGNANKFTSNGVISVALKSKQVSKEVLNLEVAVHDNGTGISEEDLQHIFEEYHQGKISSSVKNMGVGLGLNLCREIVELFKGTIHVESKEHVKTVVTFNLLLPLKE